MSMRILLSHPFCWPYVRRGSERFIEEFGGYLHSRGHEVTILSSKPGRGAVEERPWGKRILHRLLWTPTLTKLRLQPAHGFAFGAARTLSTIDVDVVHSLYYVDAFIATMTRAWKHHRTLFHITGPPLPGAFRRVPPDRQSFRQAIRRADARLMVSEFARGVLQEYHGVDAAVLPVPVDLETFRPRAEDRATRPVILAVASFDERRKGVRVLVRAFARLKETVPDALLRLSGQMSEELKRELLESLPDAVRRDVEVLGVGRLEDMPLLYRRASLTVMPSMWEAFGMVVVESWACGTPVVATNHGALPELVDDPRLGILFEPGTDAWEANNVEGLVDALRAGLELASEPETAARCVARARCYSWESLGPRYEALYS